MREVMKSMFRFSWMMSLFGARQAAGMLVPTAGGQDVDTAAAFDTVSKAAEGQIGSGLRSVYKTGDRLQSGVVDFMFGIVGSGCKCRQDSGERGNTGPVARNTSGAPDSGPSISVALTGTTQGPFWPPSEVMDQDGNFIVVGGFILTEVSPAKIVPIPNERGVIVSKNTKPPLTDGKEDFSNPLGAPYQIVRELDLGPNGKDWTLRPHSLSAGPFVGDFGGGRPRVPSLGQGQYNLNANPLWNRSFLPVGHESPQFCRPSYALDQVPIVRLDEIPSYISIGVRAPSSGQQSASNFERQPITLRDLLAGQGRLQITPLPLGGNLSSLTGARFDFSLEGLLPHSLYGFWALHAVSLLSPSDPNFLLPVPLALPNLIITDERGNASASFEMQNPFPDPARDAGGNRLVAIAVLYYSDLQSWGAALSGIATGVNAHTVMTANLSNLPNLFITG